jgi:hypothetical protein
MAKAGCSMKEAQAMLGHSHTTMTEQYTHLFEDQPEAKAGQLDALGRRREPLPPLCPLWNRSEPSFELIRKPQAL